MGLTRLMRPVVRLMRGACLVLPLCTGAALWAQPAASGPAGGASSDATALTASGLQDKLSAIQISGVDFSYLPVRTERGNTGQLFVLGMLRNTGNEKFSDPSLQARFYDSQGRLVDVLTDRFFSWSMLPGMQGVVRLDGQARYPVDRYDRVELHLMDGDWDDASPFRHPGRIDDAECQASAHWDWLEDLRTWWPFLLILMLWGAYGLVWQRRTQRQGKDLWQQQMELLARQTEAQEKIARASAEKTAPRPADTTE